MAANDSWADFENLRHTVKHNTVDKLKQVLTGFNEQCNTSFHKSGKKQDLIDRIVLQMDSWRQANNVDKWTKAQAVLSQVRNTGVYSQSRVVGASGQQPSQPMTNPSYGVTTIGGGFTNQMGRYDPYAPPRVPPPPIGASSSSMSKHVINFKISPFFRIERPISAIVECPESTSSTDRKQQTFSFTLTSEHASKLSQTSPKYQLRLYCTTSTFYTPNHMGLRVPGPCPIEFPPTCEVRVNGAVLNANLKGMKKKPGTAQPADISKSVRPTGQNRIEMVYVNSQQPVQPKKYYLMVFLVEVTTVAQLVDRLRKGKYRSCEDIMAPMRTRATIDDDDIVAGPQKMSLRCPLTHMRVETPCRSALCVHSRCFDATSWFSCMEQTPTWLCPVCDKVVNPDDLIIDGYFDQILRETPEDIEEVIVENDGQWHTNDNRYASVAWRAAHPCTAPCDPSPPRPSTPGSDGEAEAKGQIKDVEILVLDSDDEDEGRVKRELSESHNPLAKLASPRAPPAAIRHSRRDDVIDLTADSDEEQLQLAPCAGEKRKATPGTQSPTEQIWKKSRLESVVPHAHSNPGTAQVSPASPTTATLPRPLPYGGSSAVSYPGPTLPPLRLPSGTYVPQTAPVFRPPIAPVAPPRDNPRSAYDHTGNYFTARPGSSTSRSVWP
ncbi:PINIT domain-containing protein [Pisolithus orientalis]|uniref:PINIT domain-containing protein n=1 Tax=Pisolithus orientalis TaxID=936130 RepID=UPI00222421BE|nr:PINIT domain-containing protein [Pisolithus orientalis]KAI6008232.1 PINIT domain-containing protein [Pisolithus orientalis]